MGGDGWCAGPVTTETSAVGIVGCSSVMTLVWNPLKPLELVSAAFGNIRISPRTGPPNRSFFSNQQIYELTVFYLVSVELPFDFGST